MYIACIRILNYRCFRDTTVEFQPGLNVIIGENNAGKTTLLRALGLVFDRRGRGRPTAHDFHHPPSALNIPPKITVSATIRSSKNDTDADRALVALWLTRLAEPWEAQLTYTFFLPEQHHKEFDAAVSGADQDRFFEVVEEFLPKYVSRIYAGNPDTLVTADGESLAKFDCQFLEALRDVESEMFTGSTPLFRSMLQQVLDLNRSPDERRNLRRDFRGKSNTLRAALVDRLDTTRLFQLVEATGAADGGNPKLHGAVEEADFIAALQLFIATEQFSFPATHNGLGYNNLLYISLVLASLSFRVSKERLGLNAAIFPMLLIEEPEAHLHPALQYKLLRHIVARVEAEPLQNRQVFVTTHSTHITAAARLGPIVCLSIRNDGDIGVSYPAKLFPDTTEGKQSRAYVERFLDATKSAMLFAKATLFVEGISEQLIIPALASTLCRPFDEHHVAVVRVDGLTFKHFLPLFGAGVAQGAAPMALDRRVACIIDADPSRRDKKVPGAKRRSCLPFQLERHADCYEYHALSGAVTGLQSLVQERATIQIFHGEKTFEYDLALANSTVPEIVTTAMDLPEAVRSLADTAGTLPEALLEVLEPEESEDLAAVHDATIQNAHRFAAIYLRCVGQSKGEHAFALEQCIRTAMSKGAAQIKCPDYIRKAIEWITAATAAVREIR
jgi:putative ATP-dependent endonuclease of OLD family